MRRLIMEIEYDGTAYAGWQRQDNATTIQEKVEEAIAALTGERCAVHGSGRTDAGVHATSQIAHAEVGGTFTVPPEKAAIALNTKLPHDIRVRRAALADSDFHARFDAIEREYCYKVSCVRSVFNRYYTWTPRYPLDGEQLHQAAAIFCGTHDFTSFSKWNPATSSYRCEVRRCYWTWHDVEQEWHLHIVADRFVYGMVRCLTGAMTDVARGKRSIESLSEALRERDRNLASWLAPPQGLYLWRVAYNTDPFAENIIT